MKMNSVDLTAKLLANENITVVRSNVSTASFDIKSRVLTLPQWKDMSPEQEQMLVGHEVGHALYTTEEYSDSIKDQMSLMGYLNVIEDVRIEKLMKREYPGIRKVMAEGYRQLNEKDFFGISKIPDLSSLNLIDRINLYFKAGYQCGVRFTAEEKVLVDAVERTETVTQVIDLAKQVYDFSKKQAEQRILDRLSNDSLQVNGVGDDVGDDEYDEYEEDEDYVEDDAFYGDGSDGGAKASKGRNIDNRTIEQIEEDLKRKQELQMQEELEATTDTAFAKKLEALADTSTEYHYYNLEENYKFNPVIGFKRIIQETAKTDENLRDVERAELELFKNESSRVVSYLIKEFEMRKSATLYKRAQTSKSGSLDMKKIWAYKLNEDLFKQVTTIPKGKNHGMVFLLDWSGSMDSVIKDTMKQVISLAMFCHRAQIPYQVLAFSTQYKMDKDGFKGYDLRREFTSSNPMPGEVGKLNNAITMFALLELFSSKMSNQEFNIMMRRSINPHMLRVANPDFSLGGTPLNEALGYMIPHLPNFAKANNVEKMSLITLTDGEGNMLSGNNDTMMRSYGYNPDYSKRVNRRHFLQDPQTKKSYEIFESGPSQTEAIIRMIKDRFGISVVGFHICVNSRRDLSAALTCNLPNFPVNNVPATIDAMRSNFHEHGYASLKGSGRDDLFIVPLNSLKIAEGEMVVQEQQTAKQIARSFTKHLTGRKTSRLLLNQFIGYVA